MHNIRGFMKKDKKVTLQTNSKNITDEDAQAIVQFYRTAMLKCSSDEEFLKISETIADTISNGGNIQQAFKNLSQEQSQQQNESYYYINPEILQEGFMDDIKFGAKSAWNAGKQLFGGGKDPTLVYIDRVDHYKKLLARIIGEMNMDLKDLGWNPEQYPEINKAFQSLGVSANSVHQMGEEGVTTKWDRIRHKIGKFTEGAIINAATFTALNAIIPGLGSPYLHKGLVGASTAFVRDITTQGLSIKNPEDRAKMLKHALVGFGIGCSVQLASEMMNPQFNTTDIDLEQKFSHTSGNNDVLARVDIEGTHTQSSNFGTKVRALFDKNVADQIGFHNGKVDINMAHKGFTNLAQKLANRQLAQDEVMDMLEDAATKLKDMGVPKKDIANIMNDGLGILKNSRWGDYVGPWRPSWW